MSVGRVLSRSFSFIASSPAIALGSAVLFGALPALLTQMLTLGLANSGESPSTAAGVGLIALQFVSVLITLVFSGLMQAVMTRALVIEHEGGKPTLGQCLAQGLRYALPIVLLTILWWIAVAIGSVLLFVPGIILICMWAVAVPALVEDNSGITGAFGRSRELTRGHRWKVFGLLAVLVVIYYLAIAIFGIIGLSTSAAGLADLGSKGSVVVMVATALSGVIFNLLWSTIQPSLFVELRDAKEGGSTGDLEQVFS